MGILKSWFKAKPRAEEPSYEIVEGRLSIDESRFKVRVRKAGREFFAEELFQTAKNPRDLNFGRFFLLDENPPKPHFAPSLQEAVDWFTGRKNPDDGYNTIWWGDRYTYECTNCRAKRVAPLRIMQIERLTVASTIPTDREIVGWRVVEVESELTGKGIPTRRLEEHKLKAIICWHEAPNRYLCRSCAQKLTEVGRRPDEAGYFIFEPE
jgi:predicted SprT family Zn-dependent metalloprotease